MAKQIQNTLTKTDSSEGYPIKFRVGITDMVHNTSKGTLYLILYFFFLVILYVYVQNSILTLHKKLKKVETETNSIRATYMNLRSQQQKQQRESVLKETLKKAGSEVVPSEVPPQKIIVKIKD